MIYLNRDGLRIDKAKWTELQKDDSYRVIREFDNGKVRVRLVWEGRVDKAHAQSFRDTWPIFSMGVWNYRADGSMVIDPVKNGETYSHIEEAVRAYEEFLIDWTDCEEGDDGRLIEVDNLLTPPPPPDPNKPADVVIEGLTDDFGAW